MRDVPIKYPLGFGAGKILEYPDGTAAYVKSMKSTQAFRVRIVDVTGFSVTKNGKLLEQRLHILGNGSTLAFVDVNRGVSEGIEEWFRAHKLFHGNVATLIAYASRPGQRSRPNSFDGTDELRKLADFGDQRVLSDNEFQAQIAKLLAE